MNYILYIQGGYPPHNDVVIQTMLAIRAMELEVYL